MDQFEFVHSQNIKQYRNLLETSVDEAERQTIQKLLVKEETKQALQGISTKVGVGGHSKDIPTNKCDGYGSCCRGVIL
jgi:hypothetical protein